MVKLALHAKRISGILDCCTKAKKDINQEKDISLVKYVLVSKLLPIYLRFGSFTLDRCNDICVGLFDNKHMILNVIILDK